MKKNKEYMNPKFKQLKKELLKLKTYGYIQFKDLEEKLDIPLESIVELTPLLNPRYEYKIDKSCIFDCHS